MPMSTTRLSTRTSFVLLNRRDENDAKTNNYLKYDEHVTAVSLQINNLYVTSY
jgi:hypothetical protein